MQLLNPLVLLTLFGVTIKAADVTAATAVPSPSTLPTYPSSVSDISAASTVLATATPSPNLGNPANILSYPLCAVSHPLGPITIA